MFPVYDVIVVGGGHAGCEAAAAAANMGSHTLLISMDMTKFGQMSCNPAMGGIAKGQIVREIDALGGYAGVLSDKATIQFRLLNRSKGPAMWSPRAQIDRMRYAELWRQTLENIDKLDLWQDTVVGLDIENATVTGVYTRMGIHLSARTVVLTNGTFLNGLMHIGRTQMEGGRIGEASSYSISEQLSEAGFRTSRLKTGTPVRIDGRSVDFSVLEEQAGELEHYKFSYLPEVKSELRQRSCWITYTNPIVHGELELGFDDSPMYNGTIESLGPRYCPSIESKLTTFSERQRHQLYLEPEGEVTNEYYLNGFSSSLPWEVQFKALRKIPGLENAKIYRPGYAIEYDFFDPTQLHHTLETKPLKNLFFAGQINGTTGYEEAGAQGIMAGINAHLKANASPNSFVLKRDEAYIGVLIDDLVTKGVDEPYRMFTSRAEYRILLRQDNADERLTLKSHDLGLANGYRVQLLNEKLQLRDTLLQWFMANSVTPDAINDFLIECGTTPLSQKTRFRDVLSRPQITLRLLIRRFAEIATLFDRVPAGRKEELIDAVEIAIKYEGYIERERQIADKLNRLEYVEIPSGINYNSLHSLSTEARQKLSSIRPGSIGQASRIPGVSPSDVNVLLVMLGR